MNSRGVSLVQWNAFFMLIWVCGHVSRRFSGVKNKLESGIFILHKQDSSYDVAICSRSPRLQGRVRSCSELWPPVKVFTVTSTVEWGSLPPRVPGQINGNNVLESTLKNAKCNSNGLLTVFVKCPFDCRMSLNAMKHHFL